MQRILVLNPKGGSGKTTIATNLASYFASQGDRPLLSDNDPQGLQHALAQEAQARASVHPWRRGLRAQFAHDPRLANAHSADAAHVIVDTPAATGAGHAGDDQERRRHHRAGAALRYRHSRLLEMHRRSAADRQGAARRNRIGVVANRVKRNTVIYQSLMRFLETLRIPVIATLRDSQNYVRAAEQGIGIARDEAHVVEQDLEDWQPLLAWLKPRRAPLPSAGINPCRRPRKPWRPISFPASCREFCRPSSCSCASCRDCW
jgi:chromosome partitioning protein